MKITQRREAETAIIAAIVSPLGTEVDVPRILAAYENIAVFVDEEVIKNVATAVDVHVVVLDIANVAFRFIQPARCIITAASGVVNGGALQSAHFRDGALRRARAPAITIAQGRLGTPAGVGERGRGEAGSHGEKHGQEYFGSWVHNRRY